MAFDSNQLGMAIFLLIAAFFNIWFVITSYRRAFFTPKASDIKSIDEPTSRQSYQLLSNAVTTMASFDIPWVWLCMIQCWNNAFHQNKFNQNSGDDSFGCKFMGWYSTFSLVSMMGSHCLVVYYLMKHLQKESTTSLLNSKSGWLTMSTILLITACLFASMPLLQGDGYTLTSGGYCYADFTNKTQAAIILSFTLAFLSLSTFLWIKIGQWREYWYYYLVFFCTWILWVPATSYGIAQSVEIASPYMLVGAIVGHAQAIINPLLYGKHLFEKLSIGKETYYEKDAENEFNEETPDIA